MGFLDFLFGKKSEVRGDIEFLVLKEEVEGETKNINPLITPVNKLTDKESFPFKATKSKFDFVALDFETSNNQHSICSAAIVAVKNGAIIEEKEWLIRPSSERFEKRSVNIHGITYEMVKDCPSFIEIWEEFRYYIEDEIIVAHNILGTEITALKKAFEEYNIIPAPILNNYECTLQLSRILLPNLENHQLKTINKHLGFQEFTHHNALEDARTCANIYIKLAELKSASNVYTENQKKKAIKIDSYFKSQQPIVDLSTIHFTHNVDNLLNKNVVITGVFMSFERERFESILEDLGANLRKSVNGKTDVLIVGESPGPSKIEKAKALNISMISEEEFLELKEKLMN